MLGAQAAVIGTTLIFHVALVQTALPGWNWNIAWQHRNLLDLPCTEFQDGCRAEGVACWSGTSLRAEDFPAPLRGQIFGTYVDLSTRPFTEMGTTVGIDNDEKTGSIAAVPPYSCSAWSPDASTINKGTAFTQSAVCYQNQIAYQQNREVSLVTGQVRNVGGGDPAISNCPGSTFPAGRRYQTEHPELCLVLIHKERGLRHRLGSWRVDHRGGRNRGTGFS